MLAEFTSFQLCSVGIITVGIIIYGKALMKYLIKRQQQRHNGPVR